MERTAAPRTRRKPGTGYTQPSGSTWIAFYPKFGGGYHVRRGFGSRPQAEAWLDALVAQQAGNGSDEHLREPGQEG